MYTLEGFKFSYHCQRCDRSWPCIPGDAVTVCSNCGQAGTPETLIYNSQNDSRSHNPARRVREVLPADHPPIKESNQGGLIPPFMGHGLIDLLTERGYEDRLLTPELLKFQSTGSLPDFNEIEIWFDESGASKNDPGTQSAYATGIDGDIISTWAEDIGRGEGMDHMIGSYWGAVRALECASKISEILTLATGAEQKPDVTLVTDVKSLRRHLSGDWDVKKAHIRALVQQAAPLYSELNATTRKIDGEENKAEALLDRL